MTASISKFLGLSKILTAAICSVTVTEKTINCTPKLHQIIAEILVQNNNLESRKRVMAYVLRGWHVSKADVNANHPPTFQELTDAEHLILVHSMFDTAKALHAGKLASLLPFRDGAVIRTRGRLGEDSMQKLLGVGSLPILMPNTRTAELYMWRAHLGYSGQFHRSVAATLAKSRSSVWIVKGKNVAKKVVSSCMKCRIMKKKLSNQQMANIRDESLQPCPPWTFVSLDFAGPVIIKGEVNARSRGEIMDPYLCLQNNKGCMHVSY